MKWNKSQKSRQIDQERIINLFEVNEMRKEEIRENQVWKNDYKQYLGLDKMKLDR